MIADKRRSMKRALWSSYQGADVRKGDAAEVFRALINPNRILQDYDDKIISIFYDCNYQCGDIFEWIGTNTHWLIYLQDITELAYFRGNIRKCSHEISWEDEDGLHKTYAAIKGPTQGSLDTTSKHGISIDNPNYSLNILLPANEANLKYFKRYTKFYLSNDKIHKVCWRVEAIDWLSTPGILEINAVEYYANETEDDIENGIVGGLVAEPVNPNDETTDAAINGETFIKPRKVYTYTFSTDVDGSWSVSEGVPVELKADGLSVTVRWLDMYSGQFDLSYAGVTKTIVVESLF